ncbi:hypothetical protein [Actibacterium lipolyticum]|uniref:Uncharacterized protein n=1 Tax=Actibacterium lipolyticum TaxID=1524263 RepID=A0A238KGN6_9RHOB|nr:hypothetical protein [Actibacterium lipolyticum]SMX41827.1 hypothetical protein COL8621_01835 [Actibacterium lipolyticum]
MTTILILGSGPNAIEARNWPRPPFDRIVAINNAWKLRDDWDDHIHAGDFPEDRRPKSLRQSQRSITHTEYVPAQNAYGGFVYAGGTMAFTASYWVLHTYRPRVIAYLGCDMTYPSHGDTHFYGTGAPDPLRDDITLQSLEAKSARLMAHAATQGCALVNLSTEPSRLIFQRAGLRDLHTAVPQTLNPAACEAALAREKALGYFEPSGRYWEVLDRFDAAQLRALDDLWLAAAQPAFIGDGGHGLSGRRRGYFRQEESRESQ